VDAAIVVALIALVGTVGNVAITAVVNSRNEARREAAKADATWARHRNRQEVAQILSTDKYGAGGFMMWREAQRAVGELMVTHDDDVVDTIGVAGSSRRAGAFGHGWDAWSSYSGRQNPRTGPQANGSAWRMCRRSSTNLPKRRAQARR
jgi:hypothetical protein